MDPDLYRFSIFEFSIYSNTGQALKIIIFKGILILLAFDI